MKGKNYNFFWTIACAFHFCSWIIIGIWLKSIESADVYCSELCFLSHIYIYIVRLKEVNFILYVTANEKDVTYYSTIHLLNKQKSMEKRISELKLLLQTYLHTAIYLPHLRNILCRQHPLRMNKQKPKCIWVFHKLFTCTE